MRLTPLRQRLLPDPRTKPPADPTPETAGHTPGPAPIPVPPPVPAAPAAPTLVSVVRRTLAPAVQATNTQTRAFHTVYAIATLPLVIALHLALWALSTPGRLGVTVLVLYGIARTGILTPPPTH
ncbi:hypothetical protein B4N89_02255 [Embleya scabrispora]|uniref:Uncharacterized protein n=1 Tax=Embleya scabrispora TaxID=159449 RepID=A0A1T3NTB2_9ACTN|nr:hypothetical protein [Embleya scabrispora]OPC79922.1 hypothetical protein B4N89_02255 [Embleya scabrispora]